MWAIIDNEKQERLTVFNVVLTGLPLFLAESKFPDVLISPSANLFSLNICYKQAKNFQVCMHYNTLWDWPFVTLMELAETSPEVACNNNHIKSKKPLP